MQGWPGVRGRGGGCFFILVKYTYHGASQEALVVRNPPAKAGDIRHLSLIPGWGRCPGGGHVNPLQSSCLENPMGRGLWQAMVHGVAT